MGCNFFLMKSFIRIERRWQRLLLRNVCTAPSGAKGVAGRGVDGADGELAHQSGASAPTLPQARRFANT